MPCLIAFYDPYGVCLTMPTRLSGHRGRKYHGTGYAVVGARGKRGGNAQ